MISASLRRLFARHRWLVVGDSHVQAIKEASRRRFLAAPAEFCIVPGATAIGLRNPNSKTNAFALFEEALLPTRPKGIPVIHLGEVDCGFVIWWRAKKYGDSIERQVAESTAAYAEFIDRLLNAGYPKVVVTGATVPTIGEGQEWGEVANKRREVSATLLERTILTRRYNNLLKDIAGDRSLPFIDLSPAVLDRDSGVVSRRYINRNPLDHHLALRPTSRLWAKALNSLNLEHLGRPITDRPVSRQGGSNLQPVRASD